jgi:hypothetical protein
MKNLSEEIKAVASENQKVSEVLNEKNRKFDSL